MLLRSHYKSLMPAKIELLTEVEKKIWRIGSDLQINRPKTSPCPSLDEIARLAGISKMAVSYAVSVLKGRQIARYTASEKRSLYFIRPYRDSKSKAVQ